MRLAILTTHPVQYYVPLFRHLARILDVHVFFAHHATPMQQAAAGFGTAFEWDVDIGSGYAHTTLRNVASAPDASRFSGCDTPDIGEHLRHGRFDAVLTLGWHVKSLLQGIWAAKRQGLPVIVRGDSQLSTPRSAAKRWVKSLAYPAFLRVFDAALPVGARSRAYYEHYGFPRDRLFDSPHCVDTERFAEGASVEARNDLRRKMGVGADCKVVLFAGKLVTFKRPLDVIEAVAKSRAQGAVAHVVVAGAGDLSGRLDQRAQELAVPLTQLGFQNQSQMPGVYAAADVLVLPSSARETWGLVCNEALACGTPVVVSDAVGCAPDIALDGHVGRTFPLGDAAACARALNALFEQPPSQSEIRSVSERFSLAAASDGILSALEAVRR